MTQTFTPLHGEQDRHKNDKRIRQLLLLFGALAAIAAVLIALSFVYRDATYMHNVNETKSQVLTIGVTLLFGAIIIFFWSMKLTPHLHYRRYLHEVYQGLSRVVEGQVVSFGDYAVFRDGLFFYPMVVNVGDLKNVEDERLLYIDARLPRPDVQAGTWVRMQAHGNDIISQL